MQGAQSLVAFKKPDGSMTVKTYDLKSYSDIKEGKISFEVWDLKGESENGVMRIYAKIRVPGKVTVNQVWQVGSAVTGGMPASHDMSPANFNSKGPLNLVGKQTSLSGGGGDPRLKKKNVGKIISNVDICCLSVSFC